MTDARIHPKTTLVPIILPANIVPNGRVETDCADCKGKAGCSVSNGFNDGPAEVIVPVVVIKLTIGIVRPIPNVPIIREPQISHYNPHNRFCGL